MRYKRKNKHMKKLQKIPLWKQRKEYRKLKIAAKRAVAGAMKEVADRKINELGRDPNDVFRLVRRMKIESTDVVGGRCMRGNDGTLYLSEKDRAKLWKAHMSKIMNEENEWDQIADADTVEGPIERVSIEKIMEAFKHLKIGMTPGPSEVYAEMILASEDVGIRVLMDFAIEY